MAQRVTGGTKTCRAATALAVNLRVKVTAIGTDGTLTVGLAGASDMSFGVVEKPAYAAGDPVTILLANAQGTKIMVASVAITGGDPVYAAASGKVAATGTIVEGKALATVTADGNVLEVAPLHNTDLSAATTGTTAATFQVDSDVGKPRAGLKSQTGGTGDFVAYYQAPATLTADRTYTAPGDFSGSIKTDYTFPATPAATATAGNAIPVGVSQVAVGAVTNDANDWITLPAIASVPIGFQIVIACNAGTNFELRTVASSNTKINDVDADGTQEYLCTDTDVVIVTKATTTGWVAQSLTKLGAVRTAVVPD